jgi:hypothetical protein
VRHLAHRAAERSIVHEMMLLFDVIDEEQVMREIRAASRGQQRRPRHPQQRRRDEDDDAEPRDRVRDAGVGFMRDEIRDGAGESESGGERQPRLDAKADGVEEIAGDGCQRQPARQRYRNRLSS